MHLRAGRTARRQAHWSRVGQCSLRELHHQGGGGHPVEDERAGAEDARVALPQNQGSLPLRLRSPLMGAVGKAEVSHRTCCDSRRQSRRGPASLSDHVPPCPSL